jgi:hypothetical protein
VNKPKKHYVPPDSEIVQKYAKQVCNALNENSPSGYDKPNVVAGLVGFLNIVGRAYANQLNEQNNLTDEGIEDGKKE